MTSNDSSSSLQRHLTTTASGTLQRGASLTTSARHAFGRTGSRSTRVQGKLLDDIPDVQQAVANKRTVRVLFDDGRDDGATRVEEVVLNDNVVFSADAVPPTTVVPSQGQRPQTSVSGTLKRGASLTTSARHAFGRTGSRSTRVQGKLLDDIPDVQQAVANKRTVRVLFDDDRDGGATRVEEVVLNDNVVFSADAVPSPQAHVVEPDDMSPQPQQEVLYASPADELFLLNRQKTKDLSSEARSFMFWQNNPDGLYLPALLGSKGKGGEIARMIMKVDKDNNGYLSREEFREAVEGGIKEVKRKAFIRNLLVVTVVIAIVLLGGLVGVTFTAVHYTKEFRSNDDGTITRNGAPVKAKSTDFYVDNGESATTAKRRNAYEQPPTLRSATPVNTTGLNMTAKSRVVKTDPLRANNQAVTAKRIMRMTRSELSDLRKITIQTKEGRETVKVSGYESYTNVDMETNTSMAHLMFYTDQKEKPRLVLTETKNMNTDAVTYTMAFPRMHANNTDMNAFRRQLLSPELSATRRENLFDMAIDAVGEVLEGLGLRDFVDDLINGVISVLSEVAKPLTEFIDWLPTSWEEVYELFRSVLTGFFGDAAGMLTDELKSWIQIDSSGRICFSPLGGGTQPGSIDWESDDGLYRAELHMPAERNCGGVQWNDIEIDQMKVKAFFDRIMNSNPIGEIISEVVHLMASTVPTLLADWYRQFNGAFFDFVERMLGRGAREKLESFLYPILPNQISGRKRVRMMRRKLSAVMREVTSEALQQNRTLPERVHVRHMLLHKDTNGPLRDAFEMAMNKVARRRMEATAREIYHVDNLRARAKAQAAGDTGEGGGLRRRKLFMLPSAEDVKNMFWFKTIPISFDFSAEFVFTVALPNFLFLRQGDLMQDLGMPKLSISRIFPVTTAISVEVILDFDIVAPYKFLLVSDQAEVEFRLLYEAKAFFDAATGSFTARIDTSRDKKTGVRMVKGSFSGHAQMGVDLHLGIGVGLCAASFCITVRGEMFWNVVTIGFDAVAASASTETGAGAANNIIASFEDYSPLIDPPNKFIAYPEDSIAAASKCANEAESEFILAGLYINAPWPKIMITVDTPIGQVVGDAAVGGAITLMKWNWDEYDPPYVYTDIASTNIGLESTKMTILQFLATASLQGVVSLLVSATGPVGMFVLGGPAGFLALTELTRRGAGLFAEAIADLIPLQKDIIPDNIFSFTTGVVCFQDFLDFFFPKDVLQFIIPLHIPPLYEALIDAILPPRRRNHTSADDDAEEAVRRWLSDDDVDGDDNDDESDHWREACLHHGELCSDKSQCCDDHVVCAHVDYHAFRVCTTPDGAYD
ncbi:hypothetical protein RI054_03g17970 [Pseudoscourfieldia marina]